MPTQPFQRSFTQLCPATLTGPSGAPVTPVHDGPALREMRNLTNNIFNDTKIFYLAVFGPLAPFPCTLCRPTASAFIMNLLNAFREISVEWRGVRLLQDETVAPRGDERSCVAARTRFLKKIFDGRKPGRVDLDQ